MKKLAIIFLLVAIVIPAISFAQSGDTVDRAGDPNPDVPTSYIRSSEIRNIQTIVGEKTPDFIKKPIIASITWLENFRLTGAERSEGQFYHFVFANVYVFYGIFIVIVLLVLRTIWRIIF
ncbi:MAG: hypothetical protein AAB500_02310 [Patescibacteria group bacterium]